MTVCGFWMDIRSLSVPADLSRRVSFGQQFGVRSRPGLFSWTFALTEIVDVAAYRPEDWANRLVHPQYISPSAVYSRSRAVVRHQHIRLVFDATKTIPILLARHSEYRLECPSPVDVSFGQQSRSTVVTRIYQAQDPPPGPSFLQTP